MRTDPLIKSPESCAPGCLHPAPALLGPWDLAPDTLPEARRLGCNPDLGLCALRGCNIKFTQGCCQLCTYGRAYGHVVAWPRSYATAAHAAGAKQPDADAVRKLTLLDDFMFLLDFFELECCTRNVSKPLYATSIGCEDLVHDADTTIMLAKHTLASLK